MSEKRAADKPSKKGSAKPPPPQASSKEPKAATPSTVTPALKPAPATAKEETHKPTELPAKGAGAKAAASKQAPPRKKGEPEAPLQTTVRSNALPLPQMPVIETGPDSRKSKSVPIGKATANWDTLERMFLRAEGKTYTQFIESVEPIPGVLPSAQFHSIITEYVKGKPVTQSDLAKFNNLISKEQPFNSLQWQKEKYTIDAIARRKAIAVHSHSWAIVPDGIASFPSKNDFKQILTMPDDEARFEACRSPQPGEENAIINKMMTCLDAIFFMDEQRMFGNLLCGENMWANFSEAVAQGVIPVIKGQKRVAKFLIKRMVDCTYRTEAELVAARIVLTELQHFAEPGDLEKIFAKWREVNKMVPPALALKDKMLKSLKNKSKAKKAKLLLPTATKSEPNSVAMLVMPQQSARKSPAVAKEGTELPPLPIWQDESGEVHFGVAPEKEEEEEFSSSSTEEEKIVSEVEWEKIKKEEAVKVMAGEWKRNRRTPKFEKVAGGYSSDEMTDAETKTCEDVLEFARNSQSDVVMLSVAGEDPVEFLRNFIHFGRTVLRNLFPGPLTISFNIQRNTLVNLKDLKLPPDNPEMYIFPVKLNERGIGVDFELALGPPEGKPPKIKKKPMYVPTKTKWYNVPKGYRMAPESIVGHSKKQFQRIEPVTDMPSDEEVAMENFKRNMAETAELLEKYRAARGIASVKKAPLAKR